MPSFLSAVSRSTLNGVRRGEPVADDRRPATSEPLAAEVWVFDEDFARVLLVHHRWRGWVPPSGRVEPGQTPREGERRELCEETGVEAELLPQPAAATVRSYRPESSATLGLSFVAIVDAGTPLATECGQPAAWTALDEDWAGYFPEDASRVRRHARWLVWPEGDKPAARNSE
ncbi:NUDIX hydrolase [Streptomyces sp. NPDC005209]|uniref:NUDIX hydrolase n=1 Tax=Streptomyces sp. NPDC005209 TaxID=3156715 RepID=UPI0033B6EC07